MNQLRNINKAYLQGLLGVIILGSMLFILYPFFPAILMGGILALALNDLTRSIENKVKSRKRALLVLMLGLLTLFLLPTLAFIIQGSLVVTQLIQDPNTLEKIKTFQSQALQTIHSYAPTFGISLDSLQSYADQALAKTTSFTLGLFSSIASEVPSLILYGIIVVLSILYFLSQADNIRLWFDRIFEFETEESNKIIRVLTSSSREVFLSNVLTGVIQAALVTIGAAIFSISEWFLIFFITFIASFIPVVGAGPIALILSLYSFATGDNVAGVGMLVISAVSGTADNIIRPYLATLGEVEVPGVVSFLAVLGGVMTMGLPGLFLGPLIASLTFGILPTLKGKEGK